MAVEVKARLTLDTSDFRAGAGTADQIAEQIDSKDARRVAQAEARAQQQAERAVARARATAERETKRTAEQDAKDQAASKRREERAQGEAEKAAARATRQAAEAQRQAQQTADKAARITQQRAAQLQFQLNDIFTGLGSGQSPLTVAIQQGPQIAQLYGGMGAMFAAIPKGILATAAAVTALTVSLGAGIASATESAARQRQFNIELQATGNIADVTAGQLDRLVRIEAARPGADRADTAAALSGFAGNFNLTSEQQLARTLAVARDIARVQGQELPASAAELNRSLDGTLAGARRLDLAYNILTASELEQIRLLEEQGRKGDVVNIVLEAAERRFKTLNEQGISPTTRTLKELGNAWTDFAEKVGKSWTAQAVMFTASQTLKGAAMLFAGPPNLQATPGANNGLTQSDVDEQRTQLAEAEQRLADLRAKQKQAIRPLTIDGDIAAQEKRVADLRANVASLDRDLRTASSTATSAQVAVTREATERLAKQRQELVATLNTVEKQRSELTGKRDQIRDGIEKGLFPPETLKQAREALRTIDGQLAGLLTTSEKLQRDIDLEATLSKLPPHLAAGERAFQQMYRAAKEAGDDEAAARAKADQARANAQAQQGVATQQQIALLGAEARAALDVAEAYGQSRAAGIRTAAAAAARAAEEQGQIAPGAAGSVAQETLEKNAAATVAAAAEKNRAYEEEIGGLRRLGAAEAVSAEAAREAERVNRVAALAVELRAQAEASGSAAIVAAAERQIEAYDRLSRQQLELDRQRAAQQLNAQFDPDTVHAQQMADLAALQATGQLTARTVAEATQQYEQQRLDASRSATDGMIAGLRRYAEEATNAGRAAADGIGVAMRSAEDFVADFVVKGSFNFNSFVNSALADAARLATRQAITGPLASATGSALKDVGSWLSSFLGSGGSYSYGYMHGGGIVGRDRSRSEVLPAWLWDRAPRHHRGGTVLGANEVPIVAEVGEEVLTADDPRHRRNRRGAVADAGCGLAVQFNVSITNTSKAQVSTEEGVGSDGAPFMKVFVDEMKGGIASDIQAGKGSIVKAIAGRFGLKEQPR